VESSDTHAASADRAFIARGHDQALLAARSQFAAFDTNVPRALIFGQAALGQDADGVLRSLSAGLILHVANDGTLLGTGKYESLDPGWAEAFAVWLEHIPQKKGPFSNAPQVIQVPDQISIAITGDWGTGDWRSSSANNPAPAIRVAAQIKASHPDFTIHLGDVYYSGTKDEEDHLLLDLWPHGTRGSFALNSNHEMYSGGTPYFTEALAAPTSPFALQQQCSFFALENSNWIVVGLDSAYHSDEMQLYMHGSLGTDDIQLKFLREQVAKGKKIIVLTHHNGLTQDGSAPEKAVAGSPSLYVQIMQAFPQAATPAYWYWAHVHSGIAYSVQASSTRCRCCGHGALPQGDASKILKGNPRVEWFENVPANDPDIHQRVLNGFVLLTFDGATMTESFIDEGGNKRWSKQS
jgi:Calcineurin-like phosphoesterase